MRSPSHRRGRTRPRLASSLVKVPPRRQRGGYAQERRRKLERFRVSVEDLRWTCEPRLLSFRTTAEVSPSDRIIGQEKAVRALKLGLHLESPGYNLFVSGVPGTGRFAAIRRAVARRKLRGEPPPDLCYVPNSAEPERPRLISLPAGQGAAFERDVAMLLGRARRIGERQGAPPSPKKLRALLESALPQLRRFYPGEKVAAYLEELAVKVVAEKGLLDPIELGVNCIAQPSRHLGEAVHPSTISYGTLFGVVGERAGDRRRPRGDAPHARIRAGAMVEASGGVLVLGAADLLRARTCWGPLRSCLEHGRLELHDIDPATGHLRTGIRPEPIPLKLKVILVGDHSSCEELFEEAPDLIDLFQVRVDFDSEVELARRLITRDYPAFIARVVTEEKLRHFTREAVARVIEFAVRRAGRKGKITTQLSQVANLVREASFWAGHEGRRLVGAAHVDRAREESLDRLNLVETKLEEMIVEGTILIDTRGSRVGQVNGLAVYDQGDYVFGKPSRITAETSVGQGGIINIERESGFSGSSHDKGIQILGGYLRSRFAQRRPLSLTASVCFEQSYSSVDGDSASSTEIYAILSSLSGLPIRQDLAVTGSMNQKGDIQPIGGVNEKIEGFYDCVVAGRPTGREGVIIPRRNLPDLMLRQDVAEAVRRRRFHIYAIRTVEEGIEILTGMRAGRVRKRGGYSPDTVFGLADRRLEEIAQGLRRANGESA